ncbi:MAG: hypothetical protein ACOZNI_10100 [Myxococcota bacterium]
MRRAVLAVGTPEQKAAVQRLAPPDVRARVERAHALRLAIQEGVVEGIAVLGPDRVAAMLAAREDLSARYGEAKVWREVAR